MRRIIIVLAALALASCSLFSNKPTQAQLSQCLAQPGTDGAMLPFGFRLGQLIAAAEEKNMKAGWRQTGQDRYVLSLTLSAALSSRPTRLLLEFEEKSLGVDMDPCLQPALVLLGTSVNDELVNPIGAQNLLISLLQQYEQRHLKPVDRPAEEPVAPEAVPAPETVPLPPVSDKISRIFQPEMLGATVAYLEQLTGPAYSSQRGVLIYKIDGCEVIALTKQKSIRALGMRGMNDRCHFDIGPFISGLTGYPTYGELTENFSDYSWRTACVEDCGNAADPETYFQARGMHVEMFRQVVARGVGGGASMDVHYGQVGPSDRLCVDAGVNDALKPAEANLKPEAIFVGEGMIREGCKTPLVEYDNPWEEK